MQLERERTMKSYGTSLLAAVPLLAFAAAVSADTVAYWRFEEGTVGQPAPPPYQTDWFVDSSGNGNDMWTWGDGTAPVYDADVPGSQVPQTGAPNTMSLEFTPNQDNYTWDKPINTYSFDALTVEASVKLKRLDAWQVIVGKDGKIDSPDPFPAFFFKSWHVDSGARFEVGLLDANGTFRQIETAQPPVVDQWYHLAMTSDGETMKFYVKGPDDTDFVLEGSVEVDGVLIDANDPTLVPPPDISPVWTVGRGMWDGGIADWADAKIDEVRISDVALSPDQFLQSGGITPPPLGDVNLDGTVNGLDVDPFIGVLLGGTYQTEADMNKDALVNGLDVDPFVAAVVGGGFEAVPEPATWLLVALGLAGAFVVGRRR
jgi:hypothetical protein